MQGITVDLIVIRIATQQSPSPLLPTSVIAPGLVGVVLPPPPSPLSTQSSRTSIAKSDSTSRKDSTSARGWSPDTKAQPPPEYSP